MCVTLMQVLCPCVEKKKKREEDSLRPEADSDVDVLGLTAQDLRDPGAIVSLSTQHILKSTLNCIKFSLS